MSLARKLREDNDAFFEAAIRHPFVQGIGDGSLPRKFFRRWIVQDWLYLDGYLEALDRATLLAPNDSTRRFWQELARLTQDEELTLHRRLAQHFGLSMEDLEQARPYDSTANYLTTLEMAYSSYPALVATLTPCAVGYARIARKLQSRGPSSDPDYAAWVDTYMDPLFQASARTFEAELDRCGRSGDALERIESAYSRAAQCELAFWEGLWWGREEITNQQDEKVTESAPSPRRGCSNKR
ncbi:MAG: TenA family protein [Pseudomonadota bacterium]